MLETGTSGLMSGDEKRGDVSASVPALVLDSTTRQTDGCLFASGHLRSALDTFKHSRSTAAFSYPLPSEGYTLHWIGKSLAPGPM